MDKYLKLEEIGKTELACNNITLNTYLSLFSIEDIEKNNKYPKLEEIRKNKIYKNIKNNDELLEITDLGKLKYEIINKKNNSPREILKINELDLEKLKNDFILKKNIISGKNDIKDDKKIKNLNYIYNLLKSLIRKTIFNKKNISRVMPL